MATLKNTLIDDTGYLQLPSGTTAQRPVSPSNGYMRWNTTESVVEVYNGSGWKSPEFVPKTYNIEYLVVAGGGSGAVRDGGAGGAGGMLNGNVDINPNILYTITVGAGGAGFTTTSHVGGYDGTDSLISGGDITTITAIKGGGGGRYNTDGRTGGSGGGGGGGRFGGSGTTGQGNNGGNGYSYYTGGGGGGAGSAGGNAGNEIGGNGGQGATSTITGTSVTYAGGGGGSGTQYAGVGGSGIGGNGNTGSGTATAGAVNTGSGGGSARSSGGTSGAGGSGTVILKINTSNYSGIFSGSPTVTTVGAYTILKYTSSGTYTG